MRRLIQRAAGKLTHLQQLLPSGDNSSYSSVVIEYLVPSDQRWAFRRWHSRLVRTAEHTAGFIRADRHRPLTCKGGLLKWYAVIHFDQPDHLNQWLASKAREQVLEEGRSLFKAYKYKSFATGLEGWFSHQLGTELDSLGPPAWKQILSVVLGLYPIIMLQDFVVQQLDLFDDWPPARAMLVSNLITTCILTLVVMPLIVRWLDFWLQPAHQRATLRAEVVGAVFTVVAMGLMVFVFDGIA